MLLLFMNDLNNDRLFYENMYNLIIMSSGIYYLLEVKNDLF